MQAPLVHLNGTSREELLRQITEAMSALTDAVTALNNACPNLRDYYPLPEGCWSAAVAEHVSRRERLMSVREELCEIADRIADGGENDTD